MISAKVNSAIDKATLWLQSQLDQGAWNPSHVLPSLDILAQQSGVSRHTMWKVISRFKAKGILLTRRGKPIAVNTSEKTPLPNSSTWKEVADRIALSIQRGEFLPGSPLPAISKIQAHWHANYRTIKKALLHLEQQHVLSRTGARYVVPQLNNSTGTLEILFVNEGLTTGNPALISMFQLSERVSQKRGLRSIHFEQSFSATPDSLALNRFLARDTISGVILDFWGLYTPERAANFQTLLSILYNSKKQIAILDETNSLELAEPYASSARVRIFSLAGTLAGEEIGRMLLAAGHKKAAFLTTFSDHDWSQKRCFGLRQAFQRAGFQPHSVVEYATAPLPDIIPLVCATARLTSAEARNLFGPEIPPAMVHRSISYAAAIAESLCLTRHETAEFKKQVNALIFLTKATGRSITNATRLGILDDIGADLYRRYLRPLFSRILEDAKITAWVAATDSIGHQARIFLAEKKIAVPGKIALAAFDNSAGAASGRLTSYDFDPENRLQQAISFVISSPERTKAARGSNECAGILVERQSTGLLRRYT